MSGVYYNERDRHAAAWIRELIANGHLPDGFVDERPIQDVSPKDVRDFRTCHWFAGIGGWPYAMRLAGVPDDTPCWTGSCPCQPFSAAGKRKGVNDERHLWPEMCRLIRECRPATVFGEQVDAAIGHGWLDGIFSDLESEGYACGAAVLPACSVGAPHRRYRLFWVADNTRDRRNAWWPESDGREPAADCGVGDADNARCEGRLLSIGGCSGQCSAGTTGCGHWSDYEIIECGDGKRRLIESGLEPLVNGVPFRLADGRTVEETSRKDLLTGLGNAIVPQVAAEFIKAFMRSEPCL